MNSHSDLHLTCHFSITRAETDLVDVDDCAAGAAVVVDDDDEQQHHFGFLIAYCYRWHHVGTIKWSV